MTTTHPQRGAALEPGQVRAQQLARLRETIAALLVSNDFHRPRLTAAGIATADDLRTMDDYRRIPFSDKAALSEDQLRMPPFGTNLTFPLERYTRLHQTSGTTGQPVRWLDTDDSWQWWARCWRIVYEAAGVGPQDRIFVAFSFGPFIGFWAAYEGARLTGALAIPGGGMSSLQRVRAILTHEATVLVCTPTYALHLAEVAGQEGIDLAASSVRTTIHAGEPGASLPATRRRIEALWGARCFDHAGATEVGAWGFTCEARTGLHVNDQEFITEVLDPAGNPTEEGELVITALGRIGSPVIRYRTGDRVRLASSPCPCGRRGTRFEDGIIGRIDDAVMIRGVTVYPSAIENVVRARADVGEFTVDLYRRGELDEIELTIEVDGGDADAAARQVADDLRQCLGVRAGVTVIPPGNLPRYDLKARRVRDHRRRQTAESERFELSRVLPPHGHSKTAP